LADGEHSVGSERQHLHARERERERAPRRSHEPREDKMPLAVPTIIQPSFLQNPSSFTPYILHIPRISLSRCKFPAQGTLLNCAGFPYQRSSTSVFLSNCSANDSISEASELPEEPPNGRARELGAEELELLDKPLPSAKPAQEDDVLEDQKPNEVEVLAPFMKFFKQREGENGEAENRDGKEEEGKNVVAVEYYDPKPGDLVVGVVVYGNENKLDVNVGADLLGTMLTKEVLPFYSKELEILLCDLSRDCDEFMENGRMGLVQNEEALSQQPAPNRPVVEAGTVLFAEVLGRTLSGRPLLSSRRYFRRIAWHRVRQIKQLNEPIQVRITEWNTGGLLTRIEGLRAFLPKAELVTRVNNFSELKENVGRWIYVQISRINEETNDLILSEREAWEKVYLCEGSLLEGTVSKIYSYGAQVRLAESNRSGLLHMSNISRGKVASVAGLLEVHEKVKVLVLKSLLPGKISLSIAELESEPGLFISHKERVFAEAEDMAKKYRKKLPPSPAGKFEHAVPESLSFEDESNLYANWAWFKFQKED
ncbi:hypothetical protein V2J09_024240, partial [Rumex salicifolius]